MREAYIPFVGNGLGYSRQWSIFRGVLGHGLTPHTNTEFRKHDDFSAMVEDSMDVIPCAGEFHAIPNRIVIMDVMIAWEKNDGA